ncbi:MAG TPA: NAD(P)/FAD-dependent oxidoreductase [Blastocatellia bacterium]|nr:NAD(P)/FAD-dependent oxidoreductase [Blastocatellia bacterium]
MKTNSKRIVIVGGGFGGLFTALNLIDAGEITLISAEDHFLFTPMLYEYLSGEVEAWHIAPYYTELWDDKIRFVHAEVTDVDLKARKVFVVDRARGINFDPFDYDALVLAVGGVTNYWNVEGAAEYAMPFRKLEHADAIRRRMIDALGHIPIDSAPQDARSKATFAIVGAGASGVELATKMADLLHDAFRRRDLPGEPRLLIMEMGDRIVPGMGEELRQYVQDALRIARVEVHTRTMVRRVTPEGLVFEHNGRETELEAAGVVWVGGVRVNPLVEKLPLEKDRRGLIEVEETLQARGHAEVFALGDIAYYTNINSPRLTGTAQLAYQQAGLVARNVRALLAGKPLATERFNELGEAVSLGTERAAVLAGDRAFGGALARQARFAMYSARLPTWHHRLRVGASWFFEGTKAQSLGRR